MKFPHLLMLFNCFFSSVANLSFDRNLTETHVTQDPTNKETFIPVPVNNDKFSKLSKSHKSHDDEKQSNNDNNSSISINSSNSSGNNINRDNSNVDVRQTVEKKSFKNIKPIGKVQNLDIENISPPKQQQQQQLHYGNKNNYKLLDYPFQHDYETGRNPFRYVPTEEDYISKVLRSELDLIQPGPDDEVDYNNNNYNHNRRYNDNKNNNYYSQSKRYSNNNYDDDNIDYSDYDQLDDDEYRAEYLKGRINSLAHLLGSKFGFEAHKRLSDRRNLLEDYLGRVVHPRSSEHLLVKSYYDDQIEDDDVMDSYDLAKVMLKRSDTSYLDNYIDNAVRSGLLNPKLAENYRLNVMREYEHMISNHDDNENNDDNDDDDNDDDDVINDDVSDDVGDEDALPEISKDHRGQIGAEFSEHFPVVIPESNLGFESRMFDPLHHKVEKKFQLSGGHSFDDRQQELEDFAAILKQVHLENELENLARKHADQLIN